MRTSCNTGGSEDSASLDHLRLKTTRACGIVNVGMMPDMLSMIAQGFKETARCVYGMNVTASPRSEDVVQLKGQKPIMP